MNLQLAALPVSRVARRTEALPLKLAATLPHLLQLASHLQKECSAYNLWSRPVTSSQQPGIVHNCVEGKGQLPDLTLFLPYLPVMKRRRDRRERELLPSLLLLATCRQAAEEGRASMREPGMLGTCLTAALIYERNCQPCQIETPACACIVQVWRSTTDDITCSRLAGLVESLRKHRVNSGIAKDEDMLCRCWKRGEEGKGDE